MPVNRSTTPLAEEKAAGGMALLIVDMLGRWDFPGADDLAAEAEHIARAIRALKDRCRQAGVPTVYANDNHGRWRSDFRTTVEQALAAGGVAERIARQLHPHEDDYFVLKPKHSAFYATPLELLLQHLDVHRLIITGVSTDQCVLMSAGEASMHDYEVWCPSDCVATQSAERQERALLHLAEIMRINTDPSSTLRLPG